MTFLEWSMTDDGKQAVKDVWGYDTFAAFAALRTAFIAGQWDKHPHNKPPLIDPERSDRKTEAA
jgi:hypothetical protein